MGCPFRSCDLTSPQLAEEPAGHAEHGVKTHHGPGDDEQELKEEEEAEEECLGGREEGTGVEDWLRLQEISVKLD